MAKSAQKVLEIEIIEDDVEEETLEEELEEASDEDSDEVSEEELEVPEGGIADLVMDDDEIEEIYGEKASDFGDVGIAQFPALAERMAKYGRNEDKFLAHVAAGELVIPFQFLKDEAIKKRIFDVLEEAGVENPEAYVVGSDENDLNPTTGLPEFFLKKLFKGIAKVFKKIVKVIKKVLPVVLPIVLSFTPLGPIYGAAMGSGIGTLLAGGDLKDALKAGLISGATGALFKGFSKGKPGQSFFDKVGEGFSNPGGRVSATFEGLTDGAGVKGGGPLDFFRKFDPAADALAKGAYLEPGSEAFLAREAAEKTAALEKTTTEVTGDNAATDPALGADGLPVDTVKKVTLEPVGSATSEASNAILGPNAVSLNTPLSNLTDAQKAVYQQLNPAERARYLQQVSVNSTNPGADGFNIAGGQSTGNTVGQTNLPTEDPGFLQKMKDRFVRGGKSEQEISLAADKAVTDYKAAAKFDGVQPTAAGIAEARASVQPGFVTKFGPTALAGLGIMGAAGGFKVPEQEEVGLVERDSQGNVITGQDLIDADPGRYMVKDLGSRVLNEETGEYEDADESGYYDTMVASQRNFTVDDRDPSVFDRPGVMAAADGGIVYPRRSGGIMPNEGVAGKDSVRAMLMPGEFVMTTDAVRGLGQGNLDSGIQSMYSVMRNLERRGRATA
jgi:hypothetical protein